VSFLSSPYPGAAESALAELELAVLLLRAGFHVEFLPESQSRTADLECWHGQERVFVEVTAMVGSPAYRHPNKKALLQIADEEHEEGSLMFIDRLLARIAQKAKQLADYCAPVIVAITTSDAQSHARRAVSGNGSQELDLKRLSGAVTMMLPQMRHISGVLLSLWQVTPAIASSGIRLANAFVVERPRQQMAYPRVRLLIFNPAARYPLKERVIEALKGIL
jgi:hypothetical protein